jgi:hypothetical protein
LATEVVHRSKRAGGHRPAAKAAPVEAAPPSDPRIASGDQKMKQISKSVGRSDRTIVVEGYANAADAESNRRANDRANIVRNQLIDQGIAPARIKVVTKVDPAQNERVRLVAQAPKADEAKPASRPIDLEAQPVGESHFANPRPMTVDRGSSAMVSMVRSHTEGEVVYLYDAESERGNAHFAFRAVRFKNPIDSTLEVAKVFIRHTLNKGWTLLDAPPAFERVGDAHLFEVQLRPNEVKDVMITEATPIERTLDLSADVTLEMMKVWIEAPEGTPELKEQLRKLLGIHKSLVDLAQEQDSLRRRLADYKSRMDDLHAQIVTLQAVKTGGELMGHLKTKMKEISDPVQKATIQIVDQEEKIMLARVRFQDALGELALPDAAQATAAMAKPVAPASVIPVVKR